MQVVAFTLGGERYALPIERVQEVIRHAAPKPVGSPIPFVAGVIDLRGRVVPVCDVAARVGARPSRDDTQKILIVELPGGLAGVLVDAVDEVATVAGEDLSPLPAEVATDLVSAVAQLGDELVMVLDPDRLLEGVAAPPEPEPELPKAKPRARAKRKPAPAKPAPAQPSRKRSEKATRSTGGADTGSPSSVTS